MFRIIIAVAMLFAAGLAFAADADHRFVNDTVGFRVTKPASWQFLTAQQNLENLKRTEFGSDEFKQTVVKYSTVPLVIMAQHAEPYDGLNASFKANIKPFGSLPVRTGKAVLELIVPSILQQFADGKIAMPPTDVMVAGRPGAQVVIEYTLRASEGGEFPTTSEIWIVPIGDYFYLLGAGYAQGDDATHTEIEAIVSSIELGAATR